MLVEDAVGALLILFPQSQLLDLSRITELTGRKLTAVPHERLARMLTKHNLRVLPGLPALTSSPCLYDERLLQEPTLLVGSGEPGVLLEISSDDFKGMLSKASAAHFGQPVATIRPNLDRPDDDPAEITQAMHAFTARRIQQRLEATLRFRRWPALRKKSSNCGSTPMRPSMTSPASSKPIQRWPLRSSAGPLRRITRRLARFVRSKTQSSAYWASIW